MDEKIKLLEAMDVYLPDVDGVINCMHNYCLNLHDKTDLLVAVPKNRKDYVDNQPYKITRCASIYVPILGDYYGFPSSSRKFKRVVYSRSYDIIHTHSPFGMSRFALKVAKKKGVPAVATFHSDMRAIFKSLFKFNFISNAVVKWMGRRYNRYDEVFVCSPPVEEQLRSYGYKGKVTYLPFGTDFPLCDCVEENAKKANEVFSLNENELVFIFVGRLMKLKRIDFILDALKIVSDKGIDFKFYIVGKGPEYKKLQKKINKLGLTGKVILTGFLPREQFPLIFSRADLLLFPSLYDNFGLVKVEGASYSTPGLFIDGSCAGYGITDGVDGYLSKDDVSSFAEKIISAVSDREKLKKAGEKARETVYIHWSDCTEKLLNRLTEIVREKRNDNKK